MTREVKVAYLIGTFTIVAYHARHGSGPKIRASSSQKLVAFPIWLVVAMLDSRVMRPKVSTSLSTRKTAPPVPRY